MRRYSHYFLYIFLPCLLSLNSCQNNQDKVTQSENQDTGFHKTNWNKIVTYEIFVQSFYDANGDGIGDIPGLISKLDYLKDLGIGAIWLMPISPSPSYHKYDVKDYKDIHPDYGTLKDFKVLVKEAHQRNIKVLIDLVINHSSREHPWFLEAQQSKDNPYRDYYIWADEATIKEVNAQARVEDDHYHEHQWRNVEDTTEKYYGFFSDHMPDFNYDHPPLRQEMKEIGKFWLEEIGIDGFRLDAARYIYLDNRASDSHQWWEEFRAAMEKINPDVYLIGEVWGSYKLIAPFLKGLHTAFNFDLATLITQAARDGKADSLLLKLEKIHQSYAAISKDYVDATFITNHDQNRIMSELKGDVDKAKMAASLLLTLPGNPFIYYGEELGMQGEKPDEYIREPFPWALMDEGQATWIEVQYNNPERTQSLEIQEKDSNSLYVHYKNLISLRNQEEILSLGRIENTSLDLPSICTFYRIYEDQLLWVIHNLSNKTMEIPIPEHKGTFTKIIWQTKPGFVQQKDKVTIPAYCTIILKP